MGIGGAVDAVSNMARGAVKDLGDSSFKSGVTKILRATGLAQEEEFKRSPQGMQAGELLKNYDWKRQQVLNELQKPVATIHEVIKNDPVQLNSTIGKIHSDLSKTSHPASAASGRIIGLDPENANLTLPAYAAKLSSQSRLLAQQTLGENHSALVNAIMPLYESGDPVSAAHADALLSIASNQFHDVTHPLEIGPNGVSISGVDHSQVKLNMKNALMLENKYRIANEESPLPVNLSKFDTANVHEKSNAVERFASRRARWYLAPMIAINHMSTFFNPLITAPLEAISKSMTGMNNAEIRELTDAAAVFTSQHFNMLTENMANETGFLASRTGMPEVGRLYGQIFHNPGFSFIRNAQLKATAAMGYHAAGYWAEKAVQGDRMAAIELRDMGLDVQSIVQRGGQLTRDEKIKAIYHFTNNKTFISRPFDRSLNATQNPWTRMLTMFHGYVSSQQRFFRRELQKKLEAKDYVGIARFAGSIGLILPAIAPMLKAAEVFARTASPQQAAQGFQQDYKKLTHPDSVSQFGTEYLDMLSYFGSWGVLHGFITASHGDRLALGLMGPIAGDAVRTAQDAINLTTKSTKTGKRNIKPLAKDVLQQTISGAGNIIANQLFPAKTIND